MSSNLFPASLLLVASLLVFGVQPCDAVSYTVINTYEDDIMGNSFDPAAFVWGGDTCDYWGQTFAPPRSEEARISYRAATDVEGWVGIKYNASGDAPKYYIAGGRFKDCLARNQVS